MESMDMVELGVYCSLLHVSVCGMCLCQCVIYRYMVHSGVLLEAIFCQPCAVFLGRSDIPYQESQSKMFSSFLHKAGRYQGIIAGDGRSQGQREIIVVEVRKAEMKKVPCRYCLRSNAGIAHSLKTLHVQHL